MSDEQSSDQDGREVAGDPVRDETFDVRDVHDPSRFGLPPDSFPGCSIIREIHRGGQGVVYQAVQNATKRKVAIKVMKEGPFSGRADRARFDREIQILGQLNHPNIVAIHGTGTVGGTHYFVMDYVSGQPLDAYMRSGERSIEETLQLFRKISEGVNVAHLRGVIHRDLKPGNIRIDANGEPHILDFGLAKTATTEAEASLMTMTGQFMGSLPWASPEQAEAVPGKIDVRTDVYSLGVILYHMLTGAFPYEVVGNMRDVLDKILRAEPAKPSTIRKEIDDEVETIVLKCLSKERERRYQTAGELARDVGHYLAGDPIEAKRDSGLYVLKKTLRRHRVAAGVAAVFLILLASSTIAVSVLYRAQAHERRQAEAACNAEAEQRRVAEAAEREQNRARQEAEAAREEAEQTRDQLQIVVDFQSSMLSEIDVERMGRGIIAHQRERIREALASNGASTEEIEAALASFDEFASKVNPTNLALKIVDENVLSRAVRTIDENFAEHPLVRAALQQTVGDTYRKISLYEAALPLQEAALETFRRVLGDDHPDTLASVTALGVLLQAMGKYAEAEPYYRESLARRRRVLGDDHPDTLASINNMGYLLKSMGQFAEAEAYYSESLERSRRVLGPDHPDTLISVNNMGDLLRLMGQPTGAEPYYREALRGFRRTLGDDHPATLAAVTNMGVLLQSMGRYPDAEPLYREALEGRRRVLGDDHPDTLTSANNMGLLLQSMGRLADAEPYYREALEGSRRTLGDSHPTTLIAMHNTGALLQTMGKLEEAEPLFAAAVEGARRSLPEGHWHTGLFLASHGKCLLKLRRYAEAETALLKAREILETAVGPEHKQTVAVTRLLADLYDNWGKPEQVANWRAKLPTSQPTTQRTP